MSKHVTVGTPIEAQHQPRNHAEHGIEVEKAALREKEKQRDTERPMGKPFTIEAPKNYHHEKAADIEREALANAAERRDETRPAGLPRVEAPPVSEAERAQCAGKTYPKREV